MFNFLFNIVTAVVVAVTAVVVAIAVAPAAAVAVVGTYVGAAVLCLANAFNICPPTNTNSGPGGHGATVTVPTPTGNQPSGNNNNGGAGAGGGGAGGGGICFSAANAVCGLTNQGVLVGGVCNATVPPNSSCPAPVIANGTGFYADPALVRSGNTASLRWSVSNATACTVTGGGLNLANLGITGNALTGAINSKTIFTLTCINGTGGPTTAVNTTVNLVPTEREI